MCFTGDTMVINTIEKLKSFLKQERERNKKIGLVPTMGFLHAGHLSLIERAKKENDIVVVSIFVNPTQFGPNEDFETYPRDIKEDSKKAMEAGADIIFNPSVLEMYPNDSSTWVNVDGSITSILCGASRPGHFKGVTTVVNMLFNIVEPDKAYFGQKDAQQAAVLTKMVKDLHMKVELVICPIVREVDGLALSSRNSYLSDDERRQATILNKSLLVAFDAFQEGEKDAKKLISIIKDNISTMPLAKIEYVKIYSYPSLCELNHIEVPAIVAVAVKFGQTRLIDNIIIDKKK